MLKNVIGLFAVAASMSASATMMWTPSDNQPQAQQQQQQQQAPKERGWGDILGDMLGEVLNSPEVTGAVCDSLPEEYKKLCSAAAGDPKARQAAAEICALEHFNPKPCYNLVSSGNFSLPAVEVCKSLGGGFADDKIKCLREIDGKSYDTNALGICKEINWDDDKVKCLKAIKNKSYESFMVDSCRQHSWPDDKIACLKSVGL